jgi:PST family polysaccharide transporter
MFSLLPAPLRSKFVRDTVTLQIGKITLTLVSAFSTIIVTRVIGPQQYGIYGLADSFFSLFLALDISGATTITSTRLAQAIGAKDQQAAVNVLAYAMQASLTISFVIAALLILFGAPLAAQIQGNAQIGAYAAVLGLTTPAEVIYMQLLTALQSRRSMTALAFLQNTNQLILTTTMIIGVLIAPQASSLIYARLIYSYLALTLVVLAYWQLRTRGDFILPTLRSIFSRALRQSPRPYWRFGVANAIDKNLSNLFAPLIMQLVGVFGGALAAGYLALGLRGLAQMSILASPVMENMQAVVPQAVGRGDYAWLSRNFMRVIGVVAFGAVGLYGAMAIFAPLLVPLLFGAEWKPAIPAIVLLAIYGIITAIGGNFAPVYRSLGLMRAAILSKAAALVIALPIATLLISSASGATAINLLYLAPLSLLLPAVPADLSTGIIASSAVAAAGALGLDILYAFSVGFTAFFAVAALRARAKAEVGKPE